MTKEEYANVRTGDIVYPINGPLEGHAFEVIDIYSNNRVVAVLLEEYVLEWWADERTRCIRTYEEGYALEMSYKQWANRKRFDW